MILPVITNLGLTYLEMIKESEFIHVEVGQERKLGSMRQRMWIDAVEKGFIGVTRNQSDIQVYYLTPQGQQVEMMLLIIKNGPWNILDFGDEKNQESAKDMMKILINMEFAQYSES